MILELLLLFFLFLNLLFLVYNLLIIIGFSNSMILFPNQRENSISSVVRANKFHRNDQQPFTP